MYKKIFILTIILLLSLPILTTDDDEECYCSSTETLARLDATCKARCGEFTGKGVCVGWSMFDGICMNAYTCSISWQIHCKAGTVGYWASFDFCSMCEAEDPRPNDNGET